MSRIGRQLYPTVCKLSERRLHSVSRSVPIGPTIPKNNSGPMGWMGKVGSRESVTGVADDSVVKQD